VGAPPFLTALVPYSRILRIGLWFWIVSKPEVDRLADANKKPDERAEQFNGL
jgi:hypothetical protein